ncbi:unnamed protein product, partial [marine sediment metagenome]
LHCSKLTLFSLALVFALGKASPDFLSRYYCGF